MDLINDLGTDLAFAFLVEKRFGQKIDSKDAAKLIDRVRVLLESSSDDGDPIAEIKDEPQDIRTQSAY